MDGPSTTMLNKQHSRELSRIKVSRIKEQWHHSMLVEPRGIEPLTS